MENGDKVYSTCGEVFHDDEPDYDVGDHYYSGKIKKLIPSEVMYDSIVTQLMEQLEESVYEEVGEVACDNVHMADDKQEELLSIIKNFIDENVEIGCYKVIDVEEHVLEYSAYTSKLVPHHLVIEVGKYLFSRLYSPYFISHCTDTVKYMCANEQETKHLNGLGINIEDVKWDYYKIINVEK